jgi:hypothetical protein
MKSGADVNEVGILLSNIKDSVTNASSETETLFGKIANRCTSGVNVNKAFVDSLKSSITQATKAESDAKSAAEVAKNAAEAAQKSFDAEKSALNELKNKLVEEEKNIKIGRIEAQEKLAIIKTLKDIITDELLKPEAGKSFIQTEAFSSKVNKLKSLLQKSRDVSYSPLISSLLALTTGRGFSDTKILQKILASLTNIETNFREFIKKTDENGWTTLNDLKKEIETKFQLIKQLGNDLAKNKSDAISFNQIVNAAEKEIGFLNSEVQRKVDEASFWDTLCRKEAKYADQSKLDFNALVTEANSRIEDHQKTN